MSAKAVLCVGVSSTRYQPAIVSETNALTLNSLSTQASEGVILIYFQIFILLFSLSLIIIIMS